MKRRTTLKDVADAADVSMTTASFVLNGRGSISNLIRTRVLQAAKEIGYQPRRKQKEIIRAESFAILIDISGDRRPAWEFFDPIIEGIVSVFTSFKRTPVMIPYHEGTSAQDLMSQLHAIDCRMVFTLECADRELIDKLEAQNIKVVAILDNRLEGEYHTVCQDDMQAAYIGTKHLIEKGHRTIWIGEKGSPNAPMRTEDRFHGYKRALAEAGIEFQPHWHISFQGQWHHEFSKLAKRISKGPNPPTALFMQSDNATRNLLLYLGAEGVSVPRDLSIIAHGDVLSHEEGDPFSLSTMRLDTRSIGQLAAQSMLNRIRNKEDEMPKSVRLCSQLVERGSVLHL